MEHRTLPSLYWFWIGLWFGAGSRVDVANPATSPSARKDHESLSDAYIVGFECHVIHDGSLTEPFQARTGVRQGCVLWLILFMVALDPALDWVSRRAYGTRRAGIEWTWTSPTIDLCHKLRYIQEKMVPLQSACARVGLNINSGKTQEIRIQLEMANLFALEMNTSNRQTTWLTFSSIVGVTGGREDDTNARIRKTHRSSVDMSHSCLESKSTPPRVRILWIFNCNVKSVLPYVGRKPGA